MARRGQLGSVSNVVFRPTFFSATSAVKTPVATNHWHALTGNSIPLTPGTWELNGWAQFGQVGAATFAFIEAGYFIGNGADSGVVPAALTFDSPGADLRANDENMGDMRLAIGGERITISINTIIFVVTFAAMTTPANARVSAALWAERIG